MRRLVFAGLFLAASASAQPDWRPPTSGLSVSWDGLWATPRSYGTVTDEVGNPLGEARAGLLHSVHVLAAQIPAGERLTVRTQLPIVVVSVSAGGAPEFDQSGIDVGNPYVGLGVSAPGGVSVEGGVWLPLVWRDDPDEWAFSRPTTWVGDETDYEHAEAYKLETVSARVRFHYGPEVAPGVRVRLGAAPVYSYFVGRRPEVQPEFEDFYPPVPRGNAAVVASALADARLGAVLATAGVVGRYDGAGGTDTFIDGSGRWASALLGVSVGGLPVRPGLLVRLPVYGYTATDATVGLSVVAPLR